MRRWLVAIGCSIGLAVGFGPIFVFSFGLFQKAMTGELGWNRAEFSLGFSAATLVTALLITQAGVYIDRYGIRPVVLVGCLLLPAGLYAFSLVHAYPAFLLIATAMGLVGATTSYPGYVSALPAWFERHLGVALSIAVTGVGWGTALAGLLISVFIRDLGWRGAFRAMALVVLAVGLLNLLLLVRDRPRPARAPAARAADEQESRAVFRSALRSGLFWRLAIAFALVPIVSIGINFHLPAILADHGYSALQVAGIAGVMGTTILASRIVVGATLDYLPTSLVGAVLFGGQALGVLLLAFGGGTATPFIAAALLGAATGGEGDLMPYAWSRLFGQKAYGRIYGASFALFNVGTLLGPLLLGAGFDRFGTYHPVLVGYSLLSLIAMGLIATAAMRPPREARAGEA
ncbi:MAG: MFS transporter [Steroidobacteraceae bacterium]